MPECEMCGAKTPRLVKVRIDSAVLMVCDKCAKYGTPLEKKRETPVPVVFQKPLQKPRVAQNARRAPHRQMSESADMEETVLVEDYGEVIKSAREKMGWTQDELARKIMERKNVLSSIERGALMPDIKTARKLEKALGVTLLEKIK